MGTSTRTNTTIRESLSDLTSGTIIINRQYLIAVVAIICLTVMQIQTSSQIAQILTVVRKEREDDAPRLQPTFVTVSQVKANQTREQAAPTESAPSEEARTVSKKTLTVTSIEPVPVVSVSIQNLTSSTWEWPAIHIIGTRFMQDQGSLVALARARLELFKTFCLPTLKHQTSQRFLWIIRTDPNLNATVRDEMVVLLKDYPNFYLVASNKNAFPTEYRDGNDAQDLLDGEIFTGDRQLLTTAMALRHELPLLETRVDADDGLNVGFIEQVQTQTLVEFQSSTKVKWLYYCSRQHIEWHWIQRAPEGLDQKGQKLASHGSFKPNLTKDYCITPGITYGLAVGSPQNLLPKGGHHHIARDIKGLRKRNACGYRKASRCLIFLNNTYDAIRSRTPTSAGMRGVGLQGKEFTESIKQAYGHLTAIKENFHIQREDLIAMNQYVSEHLKELAEDNLKGQCTQGHSCKGSSKEQLQKLLGP